MRLPVLSRFSFRIRTRMGIVVEVILPGRDALDAEHKLHQIYRECEVLARMPAQAPQPGSGGGEPSPAVLR